MGAPERDGPHATIDDTETGASRTLIGDVDRRGSTTGFRRRS
jgi:hypothetical protein